MPRNWTVIEGMEPLPGIGPGPLSDEDFQALWARYLERGGWGEAEGYGPYTDIAAADGESSLPPAAPEAAAASEYDEEAD